MLEKLQVGRIVDDERCFYCSGAHEGRRKAALGRPEPFAVELPVPAEVLPLVPLGEIPKDIRDQAGDEKHACTDTV